MDKNKIVYFFLGVFITATLFLSINAVSAPPVSPRYQQAITDRTISIMDTQTGEMKVWAPSTSTSVPIFTIKYNK